MARLTEWLGSIMFFVALIEFVPNPKKAIDSIYDTLSTNVRIEGGHLVLKKGTSRQRHWLTRGSTRVRISSNALSTSWRWVRKFMIHIRRKSLPFNRVELRWTWERWRIFSSNSWVFSSPSPATRKVTQESCGGGPISNCWFLCKVSCVAERRGYLSSFPDHWIHSGNWTLSTTC